VLQRRLQEIDVDPEPTTVRLHLTSGSFGSSETPARTGLPRSSLRTIVLSLIECVRVNPGGADFNTLRPKRLKIAGRSGALVKGAENWERIASTADRAEMHLLGEGIARDENGEDLSDWARPKRASVSDATITPVDARLRSRCRRA
jgi:hypothetical protein